MHKLVGNLSSEAIADVLAGRAARHPRNAEQTPVQSVKEIDNLLKFEPQQAKPIRGTAYFKLFGQETRFVVINPQTVSRFIVDLISQQDSVIPKITGTGLTMDNRRAGMLIDTKVEFPTVLGVPVGFSVRLPVVTSMRGKVKATMEPKPEGGMALFKQIPQQVNICLLVSIHFLLKK